MTTTTIACMSRRRRLERLWLNTHTHTKKIDIYIYGEIFFPVKTKK